MAGFQYRTDRPVPELRKELEDLAATWPLADGAAGRGAVLPFCVVISRLSSSGLDWIGLDWIFYEVVYPTGHALNRITLTGRRDSIYIPDRG